MLLGHASTCAAGYSVTLLYFMLRKMVASTSAHHIMLALHLYLCIPFALFIRMHTSTCVYPHLPSVYSLPIVCHAIMRFSRESFMSFLALAKSSSLWAW